MSTTEFYIEQLDTRYENWEVIPEGDFEYLDEAIRAVEELEDSLGWVNLRVVDSGRNVFHSGIQGDYQ